MPRLVFGFMSGTSCDGLDGAAVRVEGSWAEGIGARAQVVATVSLDLGELAAAARGLARGERLSAREIARLGHGLAELHAEGVRRLRAESGAPDLVCAHGQTVFHDPPVSWQLVNPWPIARAAGCPVVTDLRGADLAAGGQGAPITPIADWILFRDARQTRAIVNLGGFCNVTLLPAGAVGAVGTGPEAIRARDVCACNHALDGLARLALGAAFDADGAAAERGRVDDAAYSELRAVLEGQAAASGAGAGRSLGSADELVGDVLRRVAAGRLQTCPTRPFGALEAGQTGPSGAPQESQAGDLAPEDALASCAHAVADVIAAAVNGLAPAPERVLLAGGSVRNRALVGALRERCRAPVSTTADAGVDPQYREAAAMAVLGALAQDGAPVALPHVTGAHEPILWQGSWTNLAPGRVGM